MNLDLGLVLYKGVFVSEAKPSQGFHTAERALNRAQDAVKPRQSWPLVRIIINPVAFDNK
jgi:hypothetical protein